MTDVRTVYEAAGGQAGLLRLAQAWHARVLADEVVSHAFSHGFHPEHTSRLAAYWVEALGGPPAYSSELGDETFVVRLRNGEGEHEEMDQRAIECFDRALEDVGRPKTKSWPAFSTTTSPGSRRTAWRGTQARPMTSRRTSESRTGPGTGSSTMRRIHGSSPLHECCVKAVLGDLDHVQPHERVISHPPHTAHITCLVPRAGLRNSRADRGRHGSFAIRSVLTNRSDRILSPPTSPRNPPAGSDGRGGEAPRRSLIAARSRRIQPQEHKLSYSHSDSTRRLACSASAGGRPLGMVAKKLTSPQTKVIQMTRSLV